MGLSCVCLFDRCHFNLPSVEAEEETHSKLPPIKVKFEIPYFTVSGMQVRGVLNTGWVGVAAAYSRAGSPSC